MFPEVWNNLVSRNYQHDLASVSGYKRTVIKHHLYPVAFSADINDSVSGRLYWNVIPADLIRLDRFEGEYYTRRSVTVMLTNGNHTHADIYILRNKYALLAGNREWSPEHFAKYQLKKFLRTYR